MGGPPTFESYLRAYIHRFRGTPVTTSAFRAFFIERFGALPAVAALDWDKWLYAPGAPPCCPLRVGGFPPCPPWAVFG